MDFHPAYARTLFRSDAGPEEWPERFVILSAFATTGEQWPEERNEAADRALEATLRERSAWVVRVVGFSPDTDHAEPSWAAVVDRAEALRLGREFLQDALYVVTGDTLEVVACADGHAAPVGRFRERVVRGRGAVGGPGRVSALLLAALLLGACGGEPPAADPAETPSDEPVFEQPIPPPDSGAPPVPAETLPLTRLLPVTVEGQTELREATLFESPQGYALHVLPQFTMTPEEPCCDIAWARVDDGFFMRVERISADQELEGIRDNMVLGLSAVGDAEPAPPHALGADPIGETELFMRARGDGVTSYMLVARIDGGRYRVTFHLPHREALEGIAPSMWAMLGSLRTTGPNPREAEG